MMLELMLAGATATCCHRFTADVAGEVARADIVVAAVGKPRMVQGDWIRPGATVIDIGINRLPDGKLCPAVDFDAPRQTPAFLPPVPVGVWPVGGPLLLEDTLTACVGAAGTRS